MTVYAGLQLVGGHPALDFLNTVEFRGQEQAGDRLNSFDALAKWSAAAGLTSREELTSVTTPRAISSAGASHALRTALELREALYAVVVARVRRQPLPIIPGRLIERSLRKARARAKLRYDARRLDFSWHTPLQKPGDLVARLAESAENLLLSLGGTVVHQCSGPDCDWMFVDRSHGHRRLWCQPEKCGNIVRVRRSRAR
jgi:predicted RNA-binding Zn ribbon-like protein